MSLASVTIEHFAWGDPRVHRLARLLGYSDPDFALIKLGKLWARCIYLGTDQPGEVEIQACLDDRGPELLVQSGLGEQLENGDIRVKGAIAEDGTDRIGWFRARHPEPAIGATRPAGRAAGGKARASAAPRSGGRFVKSTTKHQQPPATHDAGENAGASITSNLANAGGSGSGSGSDLKISPARAGNAGDAGDQQRPASANAGENAGTSIGPGPLEAIWIYGQRKHLELRTSGIDPHAQAWSAMPAGTGAQDLRERIAELRDRRLTNEQIVDAGIHVVDVRAAEARAFQPPHLRFFIASRMFTAEAWSKATELSPEQAAAQAAQGKGAPRHPPRGGNESERPRRIETVKPV